MLLSDIHDPRIASNLIAYTSSRTSAEGIWTFQTHQTPSQVRYDWRPRVGLIQNQVSRASIVLEVQGWVIVRPPPPWWGVWAQSVEFRVCEYDGRTCESTSKNEYQGHPVWVSWLDYPTLRKQASIGHPLDVLGRYCNRLLNLLPNQWILLRGIIKCVLKLDQREGLLYAAACSLEKVPGKKRY